MRLLNKAAVIGSGVLMIHATICAIQRERARNHACSASSASHVPRIGQRLLTRVHCSALADRTYLKAVQQPFEYPPLEVRRPSIHPPPAQPCLRR